ncbi:MAG: cysteine rich repeat-containing protein [Phreatobacter sp.]|uniref:cysteine rich repeat-containing protein n=1 Tax=Phreatobacter sp. TaxID=1966341 RepID=UPI002735F1E2|nr:cysteine rich repeat-containing protein [Phreatobacter sp.]MDP2801113.1 cysteine rich repeat-containing protein [Phreatobacter sp.]
MTRRPFIAVALVIAAAVTPLPALGQNENLSFSQRMGIYRACKADLDSKCPSAGTDSAQVSACLRTNQAQLSTPCVAAIRQAGLR